MHNLFERPEILYLRPSCFNSIHECRIHLQDWADLWRPELAGKISMVDSPREVIGAVLKSMGASYNTTDIDAQVNGGRKSVQKKLAQLGKQVCG